MFLVMNSLELKFETLSQIIPTAFMRKSFISKIQVPWLAVRILVGSRLVQALMTYVISNYVKEQVLYHFPLIIHYVNVVTIGAITNVQTGCRSSSSCNNLKHQNYHTNSYIWSQCRPEAKERNANVVCIKFTTLLNFSVKF